MTPEPREGFDPDELPPWEMDPWDQEINWGDFWTGKPFETDWLIEPVVANNRQTAIYSPAKTGKSLLALDIVAAAATGRSILGYPEREPISVLYLDLEMTLADLYERMSDLGYGDNDDLKHLHYYQLPDLPPLDSEPGGETLMDLVRHHQADLVVIDTMSRVVAGKENDADTYRNFFRCTGVRLKAAHVAMLRLDHEGKDAAQGQRGSSAKGDDVDILYRLTQLDASTLKLTRTRSRPGWVPAEVSIQRQTDPVLRHVADEDAVPAGTLQAMKNLDDLDVPLDATADMALTALRNTGHGTRKAIVLAALKARKKQQSRFPKPGNHSGTALGTKVGN